MAKRRVTLRQWLAELPDRQPPLCFSWAPTMFYLPGTGRVFALEDVQLDGRRQSLLAGRTAMLREIYPRPHRRCYAVPAAVNRAEQLLLADQDWSFVRELTVPASQRQASDLVLQLELNEVEGRVRSYGAVVWRGARHRAVREFNRLVRAWGRNTGQNVAALLVRAYHLL